MLRHFLRFSSFGEVTSINIAIFALTEMMSEPLLPASSEPKAKKRKTTLLQVTHKVWMEISIGGEIVGTICMGLFGEDVPLTVMNFVDLANKPQGEGYKKSKFHRVSKDFMLQGGDLSRNDGNGGSSIFGDRSVFKWYECEILCIHRLCLVLSTRTPS